MQMSVLVSRDRRARRAVRPARRRRAQPRDDRGRRSRATPRRASSPTAPPFLHLVDLDGAFSGTPTRGLVERIAAAAGGTPVQAGGGYRTLAAIDGALAAGAARVMVGTAALSPAFVREAARAIRRQARDRGRRTRRPRPRRGLDADVVARRAPSSRGRAPTPERDASSSRARPATARWPGPISSSWAT